MATLTDSTKRHIEQLIALHHDAIKSHHRRMIVITGRLDWSLDLAETFAQHGVNSTADSPLWIAKESPEPPNRLQQIIGSETALLVFNAHHGFDPNLFGAATGAVVGGGLTLLLVPDFAQWHAKSDPVAARITVYPYPPDSISNHYIKRLIRCINDGEQALLLTILRQSSPPIEPLLRKQAPSTEAHPEDPLFEPGTTADQQQTIDAIIHTAKGHRHRPLVITADRGRGKSAALGIAAARLMKSGKRHIVVTAPGLASVETLFKHNEMEWMKMGNENPSVSLEFIAPDKLIQRPIKADLVLVDEAAAIATPILGQILEHHARVIFATTTHGYEGSGQGFALRFLKKLKVQCPNFTEIQLNSPIRWADHDPVEQQVNQMLLLNTEPKLPEALLEAPTCRIDRIERLDRAQLANNEPLLQQLFGLLVLAHYRTTPLDLRQLLDGPNLSVYIASSRGTLIATALVADEGEIDDEALVDEIWLGHRRPQGHLLPQTLIAHVGIKAAASLRYRRIIRIAVHPQLQRRGIGRALMDKIGSDATAEQIDLLGTSYGATAGLLRFWNQNRLTPLFIGSHRNASSGTYALTQMRVISKRGQSTYNIAIDRFQKGLLDQLRDPLQQLDGDIVCQLLKPSSVKLNSHDMSDVNAFIHGNRRYETVITPLIQLLLKQLHKMEYLPPEQRQLLTMRLLQNHSWSDCATRLKIAGRKALQNELRQAISMLQN